METIAIVAVVGLVVVLCVGNVMYNAQLRAILEESKRHDRYMAQMRDEFGKNTKEIIDATGSALAKNLVGYGLPAPVTIPEGMDTLGLTEDTGIGGLSRVAYPEFEQFDPWQTEDVRNAIREMYAPVIQSTNGAESSDADMGPVG